MLAVFLRITFPIFQPRPKCSNIIFVRIELANDREQCCSQTFQRPRSRLDFIEVVILYICDCAILIKMDDTDGYTVKLLIHLDKDGTVIDVEDYNLDKVEPDLWAIKGLAASLLPVIREFYTHEENVQAFEAWLKERENNPQKHSKRK